MPRSRLLLAIILLAFAAACIRLGLWQLDRLGERRVSNAAAVARRGMPELLLPAGIPAESLAGRPVRAMGSYDRENEIVLRGQVFGGVPGVVLVTPLHLEGAGDTAVLVERGFVPSPDALTIPTDATLDEPGPREVRGLAFAIPDSGDAQPLERDGRVSLRRLDLARVRSRVPYPVLDVVLRQMPDPSLASFPRRRPVPPLDEGPHRLYAIQWFAFALTAVVFAGVFLRKSQGAEDQRSG
ncbi:MAG: SURF1 family protein [Gemmatimonadales bacterium]